MRGIFLMIMLGWLQVMPAQKIGPEALPEREAELKALFDRLYSEGGDSIKTKLARRIVEKFGEALSEEASFDYPWNSLDKIGKISSDDRQIRIFTWHLPLSREEVNYYGFIQIRLKRDRIRLFRLQDDPSAGQNSEIIDQSVDKWHGKLYYSIVEKHYEKETCYTLLGMDFNNPLSTIKTVEALAIRRNKPVFLKNMFLDGPDRKNRMVLEYSSQVAISMRYNEQLGLIVFDHLTPLHPVYTGNYEFYGPDGSFDGLEFVNGTWILREDVDARNPY
ncbi:MAG: hypothetical protein JXR52_02030 [Bacteroidales bacterium]|nr:hypothetical protein [Bacteroidales bacterium]MBN2697578.1 hypothetical protein [Bacteroidales bacterium]